MNMFFAPIIDMPINTHGTICFILCDRQINCLNKEGQAIVYNIV